MLALVEGQSGKASPALVSGKGRIALTHPSTSDLNAVQHDGPVRQRDFAGDTTHEHQPPPTSECPDTGTNVCRVLRLERREVDIGIDGTIGREGRSILVDVVGEHNSLHSRHVRLELG